MIRVDRLSDQPLVEETEKLLMLMGVQRRHLVVQLRVQHRALADTQIRQRAHAASVHLQEQVRHVHVVMNLHVLGEVKIRVQGKNETRVQPGQIEANDKRVDGSTLGLLKHLIVVQVQHVLDVTKSLVLDVTKALAQVHVVILAHLVEDELSAIMAVVETLHQNALTKNVRVQVCGVKENLNHQNLHSIFPRT